MYPLRASDVSVAMMVTILMVTMMKEKRKEERKKERKEEYARLDDANYDDECRNE